MLNFQEYEDDASFNTGTSKDINNFFISKDGICFGLLSNFRDLERVNIDQIQDHKENISIADIDDMYEYELYKIIKYYLGKENIEIDKEIPLNIQKKIKTTIDGLAKIGDKTYLIEIKTDNLLINYDKIKQLQSYVSGKGVLITNKKVSSEDISHAKKEGIIIIDRERFKKIIRNKINISSYLS